MNKWTVTKMSEGVWNFNEEAPGTAVDAYLICGSKRAVFVDALQTVTGLYERAKEITELPIDLVLTHGHYDHAGPAMEEFHEAGCDIYLNRQDWGIVGEMVEKEFPRGYFKDLKDGQKFDLGGKELEVFPLPGHTPGSVALIDRDAHLIISGDGIGSGPIWMQLPHSKSVACFRESVKGLLETVQSWEDLKILQGHKNQAPAPLGLEYVKDVCKTAEMICSGELKGEEQLMENYRMHPPIKFAVVEHGLMQGFFYDPYKIM